MKHTLSAIALLAALGAPAGAQQQVAAATNARASNQAADDLLMTSVLPTEKKPTVVRAAQNLRAGSVLHSSDLLVEGDNAQALELFVGLELKRAIYQGKTLSPNDVGPPTVVTRNAIVQLEFVRGPLMISTEGRALDAGAVGDSVRVMNLSSKIILTAVITGPNKAVTQ